ncbi:MAG TPA: protein kinase, partial [Gemmataceae bacterium]|nr:protein kinase [Gemmataceae bacterium]
MPEYVKCPNGHQVPAGETECAQCRTLIQQEPLPLPSEPLFPRIPGYEILGELGRGGMGVVYKARHLALKRLVAVKTIRHLPLANADELHRFQREAEAVAAFQHPHIVQIHEIGAFEGMPYFTQELVEGGTLAAKLGGQPQPIMETAHLLQTLALAVDVAHQRGLVHRDLKPGNILLTADGQPKISDFGLAKRIDESGGATTSGAVVGTPSYMAPEQARGATHKQGIAAPADIYALGVILYEMLTGRPPFLGESVMDTVQQVLNEEPVSPRRLQPRVPRDLETICLKCLEKEPARRYASAKALAEDLGRFGAGEPVNARPVGLVGRTWRWARRNRVVATLWGLLFLVFAGGLGGIIWNWRDARYQEKLANLKTDETKSANKETELALEKMTKANQETKAALKKVTKANQETEAALEKVTRANQETEVALQRLQRTSYAQGVMLTDRELQANRVGQAEQFLAGCPEKYRDWEWHYLKRMCHNELLTLRGHAGPVTCVAWNEKSASRIASGGRDKTIRIWDGRTGREILKISDNDQAIAAVAFNADGGQLVSASHVERGQRGHGQFTLWNAHTGTKIRELPEMTGTMPLAAFTPDGKLLATCSGILNSQEHAVKFWQVATGQETFRLSLGAPPSGLAFSADGRFLATGDSVGKLTVWDLATRKAVKQEALGKEGNIGLIVAFSPSGKQLAAAAGGAQLWLLGWETPEQRIRLQGHAEDVHDLAFSPNGSALASASWDRTVKVWHTATGASAQTLRGHTEAVYSLAFNADGSRLVTAGEDATLKIWDLVERPEER